jgi:hypothetical protein
VNEPLASIARVTNLTDLINILGSQNLDDENTVPRPGIQEYCSLQLLLREGNCCKTGASKDQWVVFVFKPSYQDITLAIYRAIATVVGLCEARLFLHRSLSPHALGSMVRKRPKHHGMKKTRNNKITCDRFVEPVTTYNQPSGWLTASHTYLSNAKALSPLRGCFSRTSLAPPRPYARQPFIRQPFLSQIALSSHLHMGCNQRTAGALLRTACFSQGSPYFGMLKRGFRAHAKLLSRSNLIDRFSLLSSIRSESI